MSEIDRAKAAERAANACAGTKSWLADIGAKAADLDAAAAHVRRFPDAPAEALFLTLTREPMTWADLQGKKRLAVEAFVATLRILDRLAAEDAARAAARAPRPAPALPPADDNPLLEEIV